MIHPLRGIPGLLVALLATLAILGCPPSDPGRTPSARSPRERDEAPPRRIISCAPNLTEMLFALGAGDRVIGVTRYCQFPPEARTRAPLGDLFNPNLEAMVAARPDLIVFLPGSTKIPEFFGNHPGPRLLSTNACETIAEIQATILELGRAIGDTARAEALVDEIRLGLERLKSDHAGAERFSYLMVLGHEEGALEQLYAVGQPTYLTELMTLIGGINVIDPSLGRYPILSREALLERNPQVILERHLGAADEARRAALQRIWKELPTLNAVRHDQILIQDDDHVTINGPDLVGAGRTLAGLVATLRARPQGIQPAGGASELRPQ